MRAFLEQGYGVMLIGGVTGVGMICRFILFVYYIRLGRACKAFGRTKNKTVTYIRKDLEQRGSANLGIKSAMLYTECRLAECKVMGIRLGILESVMEQSLLLILLSGVLVAFSGVMSGGKSETVVFHLFVSGVTTFVVMVLDLFTGLREKNKRVRLMIRDYIENTWMAGAECAGAQEEPVVQEKKSRTEKNRSPKKSAKKVRSARDMSTRVTVKKHGKAQEEKRRLTEELLRERRQLEARHFAEQRSKEQEAINEVQEAKTSETIEMTEQADTSDNVSEVQVATKHVIQEENAEQQVQAEAAATENVEVSYEVLLNEVLAEYLV